MDMLTTEVIMETWLKPNASRAASPDVPDNAPDTPELLRMPPHVLLDWLSCLRSGYRITLQLAELTAEDVLELLWDCQGMITHLELFNLKEWQEGHLRHLTAINDLQIAINKGSVLHLKQILRGMIRTLEASSSEKDKERCAKFRIILRNIPSLQAPYKVAPLRIRIGTDSTSHSGVRHGMGLAMPETLPTARAGRSPGANSSGPFTFRCRCRWNSAKPTPNRNAIRPSCAGSVRACAAFGGSDISGSAAPRNGGPFPALPRSERKATSSRWAASAAS